MSLASRLSSFFLAALAVVLVGFSTALYALSSVHLHRLVDERLDSALATLAAAAEIGPLGVEWEPNERELGLGREAGLDQIRWAVFDDVGRAVGRSANLQSGPLAALPRMTADGVLAGFDARGWRLKSRRLGDSQQDVGTAPPSLQPGAAEGPFPWLMLMAYAPLGPTDAALGRLGWTSALLSVGLWLAAAAAGRRLCKSALAPLSRMAAAARHADATEAGARLPAPGTGDELDDLADAFNGLLKRFQEAVERQRRFAGDASHQLRTPIAGLLSQVDVTLRRARSDEEYRRVLGVVRAKSAYLGQVVESLLFLARTEGDGANLEAQPIDLARWLADQLAGWADHSRAHDLVPDVGASGPLWARIHPPLLTHALNNLLENAFKYSAEGTPVVVQAWRENGTILLSVEDHGRGIAAADLPRVFEPFYQGPRSDRGGPGVGLGLSVAARAVAVFGGSIRVESEPGRGSRFVIHLAASAEPPPDVGD